MIIRKKRKSVFSRSVWTMLAIFFILFTVFLGVSTSVATDNSAAINMTLGVEPYKKIQVGDGEGEDLDHYKSNFIERDGSGEPLYSEDINGNKYTIKRDDEMRENSKRISEQTAVEGSVILWNDDNALPLAEGAKISLFGMSTASGKYVFSGSGSGHVNTVPTEGTLVSALTKKGFDVNGTLAAKYEALKNVDSKYGFKYGRVGGYGGANTNYMPYYAANEAGWNEISSATLGSIKDHGDAAVMVLSRSAGEDWDISEWIRDKAVDGTNNHLQLSVEEAEVLEQLAKLKGEQRIGKIVVLLNTANPLQFDELLKDKYGVDACVLIGQGGTESYVQIADVLAGGGDHVVSGHLADTLLMDNRSAPSYANFGDYDWTAANTSGIPDWDKEYGEYYQTHNRKYIVYQEGIYVGYRYYETRYEDLVLGNGSADGESGSSVDGGWDYKNEVAFPFGYGSSFTQFKRTNPVFTEILDDDNELTGWDVSLDIANSGDTYAGKDVLQVYIQKPYTDYDREKGIEKSSVELVGFAKTGKLDPDSDAQTLTVNVSNEELRTYDAYGYKTYILEEGDYYIAIGTDAHDAVNNILAKKIADGKVAASVADRMDAAGDASMVYRVHVGSNDYTKFKFAPATGNEITNRFDDADINLYEGTKDEQPIQYLSRNDWNGTFPTEYFKLACTNEIMVRDMQYGHEVPVNEGDTLPEYNKVTSPTGRLSLAMMTGLDYDDPLWEHLLNQMTLEEQNWMGSYGLGFFAGAASVDAPGGISQDGPQGILSTGYAFPSPILMASTYDAPLVYQLGDAFAHETMHAGFSLMYAPGACIHRSLYSGRNFEYFSEDGVLSGKILAAEVKGITDRGIIVMTKHFAFNDQERNRYGVATFFNEQSGRDIYLRVFEIAVREGNMNGVMSSFNRIGLTWAGSHKGLLTDVLRGEWDFIGIVETDSCTGNTFHMGHKYAKAEGLVAGNDMWMSNGSKTQFDDSKDNATVMLALRQACHRILYTQLNSAAMNGVSVNTRIIPITPWWEQVLVSATAVIGVVAGISVAMAVLSFVFLSGKFKAYAAARKAANTANGKTSKLSRKMLNIIIICVLIGILAVAVLVATLVPVMQNMAYDRLGAPKPHECKHVCQVCGGCTNLVCEKDACAVKCGDGKTANKLEAETDAKLIDGTAVYGSLNISQSGDRTVVGNINGNKGAQIIFGFISDKDTTATLRLTVNRRNRALKLNDIFGISINGDEYLQNDVMLPQFNDQWSEESFMIVSFGCITIKEGYNTISFTVLGDGNYSGVNMDCIELMSDETFTVHKHFCGSKCVACGKCTDADCDDLVCADKCTAESVSLEAEDAVFTDGEDPKLGSLGVNHTTFNTFVENFNGNKGAKLVYTFTSDVSTEAILTVTVSKQTVQTLFTDLVGVSVNGGEYIVSDAFVPAYSGKLDAEGSFIELDLGKIMLIGGQTNTIEFVMLKDYAEGWPNGYCFDKITLYHADCNITEEHVCKNVCEVCGGCKDYGCKKDECKTKCSCDIVLEAEDSRVCTYHDGPNPNISWGAGLRVKTYDTGRTIVEGFNGNPHAYIEFTIESADADTRELWVTINRRGYDIVFTDAIIVTHNGTRMQNPELTIPSFGGQWGGEQWSDEAFESFFVATVTLVKGENKFRFEIATDDNEKDDAAFNFDKIELRKLSYDITVSAENGTVTPDVTRAKAGTTVTLSVEPNVGYELDTIKVNGRPIINNEFTMPAENAAVVATFRAIEYTISVDSGVENGTIALSATAATMGTTITVTATPAENYELVSITVNGSAIRGNTFSMPAENVVLGAIFRAAGAPKYKVDFVLGEGSGDITGLDESYSENDIFKLPDGKGLTRDGYGIVGWNDGTKDLALGSDYTMPAKAVTFTALWAQKSDMVFEAEHATLNDGTKKFGALSVSTNSNGRVYVGGVSGNKNATVTFDIWSEYDCSVLLSVTVNRRTVQVVYTDCVGINVNGTDITSDAVITAVSSNEWDESSFADFDIAEISLKKGANTIVFTILTEDDVASNFDKLTLKNALGSAYQTTVTVAGGDGSCVAISQDKFDPWNTPCSIQNGVVSGLNCNPEAYAEITYYAASDCDAEMVLRHSMSAAGDYKLTDYIDITIQYGDDAAESVTSDATLHGVNNWNEMYDNSLGTFKLKAGVNKIRFTVKWIDPAKLDKQRSVGVNIAWLKFIVK